MAALQYLDYKKIYRRTIICIFIIIFSTSFSYKAVAQTWTKKDTTAVDSQKVRPKQVSLIWRGFDFGLGLGAGNIDKYGKTYSGFGYYIDLICPIVKITPLNGLGLEAKLFEGSGSIMSLFPIYIQYPLNYKANVYKTIDGKKIQKYHVYIFAGGNNWFPEYDYLHLGISAKYIISKYEDYNLPVTSVGDGLARLLLRALPFIDIGLQAGFTLSSAYTNESGNNVPDNFGFYITFTLGSGSGY